MLFPFRCRLALALALTCVAIALPVGAQPAASGQASALQEHFAAALHDQQSGNLDDAVKEYKEVLHLDPNLAEAYANLGLVYYAQSKFRESAGALATAAKLKPGMEGVVLWLGVDNIKLGRPKKAVPLLREAGRMAPSDLQVQKWLGTALWNAGETFAALDQLARTSERFPSDADSCFVLGEAYRKAANYQIEALLASASGSPLLHQVYGDIYKDQHSWIRASAHYRKASEEDPRWKGAHLGLAEIDLAQNHYAKAEDELHLELKVAPSSTSAKALLGEVKLLTGEVPEALTLLGAAIQMSPYGASASLGLPALLTLNMKDEVAESASLRQTYAALERAPASPARSLALAVIDRKLALPEWSADFASYRKAVGNPPLPADSWSRAIDDVNRGRFAEAKAILTVRVDNNPGDREARYLLAKTFKSLSLQTLNRLIAMDPDSPRVHQLLGQTYEDRDDDDKALAEYRIVEKMDPSLPGIHYAVGHLLWKFGDRANALAELHQELKLDPTHAEANGEIGTILVIENEPGEAIPYLQAALRIDPGLVFVHQQLGKAYMLQKNYSKAAEELKLSTRSDLDGSAHYELGMVYRKMGRTEEARKEIDACARIRAERLEEKQSSEPSPVP